MTKHPIEVITSVERRRRWSREDKERLVAACLEPGAVLFEIARTAGIHVSQLFRWRKELCRIEEPSAQTANTLVPVIVSEAAPAVLRISLNTDSDFIKSRVAISLKCGQFLASRFQACPLIIVSCFRD